MKVVERYRRLNFWNKLFVWGALASIIGVLLFFFWPANRAPELPPSAVVDQSPGTTVIQPGRDLIINPPQRTGNESHEHLLSPQQEKLLGLLSSYQRQFGASKLIISRTDGHLHFDNDPKRGSEISLIRDLFGTVDAHNAGRFEQLVESMPSEYVRLTGEARFDNPFVISITETGNSYLSKKAQRE